jgi:membrane AbrB-like protein
MTEEPAARSGWKTSVARSFGPKPKPLAIVSLLLAIGAGWAGYQAQVPLAWVLGPMIATAACSIGGLSVYAPVAGRRFGQLTIGTSIGLTISSTVLATIVQWLPVMVGTALVAMLTGAFLSIPYAKLAGIDRKTAYFAMMPGGMSEMSNIGARAGAEAEPIALAQALRVAMLVLMIPPLIIALDIHGSILDRSEATMLGAGQTLTALVLGMAGVGLAQLARLNNPWMIGAVVCTGAAAASALLVGRIPVWLFYFGQFMIGLAIGARFKRENVLRLPRLFGSSVLFVVLLSGALSLYAFGLSRLTGLDLATAALGSAPGGFAEMSVTAQTLHLSVGFVTAFHVVRAFLVNGFADTLRRVLESVRWI